MFGIQNTVRLLEYSKHFLLLLFIIEGINWDEIYFYNNLWNTAHTTDFYGIHHDNLF